MQKNCLEPIWQPVQNRFLTFRSIACALSFILLCGSAFMNPLGFTLKECIGALKSVSTFGQHGSKAVGDYAAARFKELERSNSEEAALWVEGGIYRVMAHAVVGGLAGGLGGAIGAAASQYSIDAIGKAVAATDISTNLKSAVVILAGTVMGATGGAAGAAAGFTATVHNYLNHSQLIQKSEEISKCETGTCRIDTQLKWSAISQDQNSAVVDGCLASNESCHQGIDRVTKDIVELTTDGRDPTKRLSGKSPEQRNNLKQAIAQVANNLEILAARTNEKLGTTYNSPEELVVSGIITLKESRLLKSVRAYGMADFLGIIATPDGASSSPQIKR